MSKPADDDQTLNLDDFLNQDVIDTERFAAFLKRQTAPKPKCERLFGNLTFDVDFEVPVIKKPAADVRPLPGAPQDENQPPPLQPLSQANARISPRPSASGPGKTTSPTLYKSPPPRRSLRPSGSVPGSDKLRRHAIRRRSQSCGRQLLKEFEEVIKSPSIFNPATSSTPLPCEKREHKLPEKTESPSPEPEKQSEPPANPEDGKREPAEGAQFGAAGLAEEISRLCVDQMVSFRENILQLNQSGRAPASPARPGSPTVSSVCPKQRTYTIEKGPAPGQLILSPSRGAESFTRQPVVKLKRCLSEVVVPNTPPPTSWHSQPEPEFVVPETQAQHQDLGELVQNLSRNASGPIVVINAVNSKANVPSVASPVSARKTVSQPIKADEAPQPFSPGLALRTSTAIESQSPAVAAQPQANDGDNAPITNGIEDLITDDESDEEQSARVLNLAPPGGNTTRRNRARIEKVAGCDGNSIQLLNLHQPVKGKKTDKKPRVTMALNKAPNAPINGEQFAEELARMSHYEILDLRKRNSMGMVYPVNGHRKRSVEQQKALEKSIRCELLRRNLPARANQVQDFTSNSSGESGDNEDTIPRTRLRRGARQKPPKASKPAKSSHTRTSKRVAPVTTELVDYINMSKSRSSGERFSVSSAKRNLYTKGDSINEDLDSAPSPEKQSRLGLRDSEIAIVPPPPTFLRFSRSNLPAQPVSDDGPLAAPPEFEDYSVGNTETVAVPLPPPDYVDQGSPKSRFSKSLKIPPPLGFDGDEREADEYVQKSVSRRDKASSRKSSRQVSPSSDLMDEEKSDMPSEPRRSKNTRGRSKLDEFLPPLPFEEREVTMKPNSRRGKEDLEGSKSKREVLPSYDQMETESVDMPTESRRSKNTRGRSKLDEVSSPPPVEEMEKQTKSNSRRGNLDLERSRSQREAVTSFDQMETESMDMPTESRRSKSTRGRSKLDEMLPPLPRASDESLDAPTDGSPPFERMESSSSRRTPKHAPSELDDGPSTSHAARLALQITLSKSNPVNAEATDDVFKKPLGPAPRAKSKKKRSEVDLLALKYEKSYVAEDHDSNGTRRSARGHVPLQNRWQHSDIAPEKLKLLSKAYDIYDLDEKPKKKSKKSSKKATVPNSTSKIRGPLCSSTPRDPAKAPEDFRNSVSIGVDLLEVTEEPQPPVVETVVEKGRKRGRKKKTENDEHKVDDNVESPPEQVTTREVSSICTQTSADSATMDDRLGASISWTNWLRGCSSDGGPKYNDQIGSTASPASDLIFTTLEGIDYAFYNTQQNATTGYMRFQPLQHRPKKRAKNFDIKFKVEYGEFAMQTQSPDSEMEEGHILRIGDFIEIDKGVFYSIQNILNDVSVLFVMRCLPSSTSNG